jgi:propanol-preferring alcohol dehydrogenase
MKGLSTPGFFSEYTVVDAATAVVVPPPATECAPLDLDRLAPLFCAGITAWDALERAKIRMGETVAVVGMGGIGQMVAQYAHAFGARVIALDVRDEQLAAAKADGIVDVTFNTKSLQGDALVSAISEVSNGSMVDHAMVTSGAIAAYDTALAILKAQGQLVAVGLPLEPLAFQSFHLAIRCIR